MLAHRTHGIEVVSSQPVLRKVTVMRSRVKRRISRLLDGNDDVIVKPEIDATCHVTIVRRLQFYNPKSSRSSCSRTAVVNLWIPLCKKILKDHNLSAQKAKRGTRVIYVYKQNVTIKGWSCRFNSCWDSRLVRIRAWIYQVVFFYPMTDNATIERVFFAIPNILYNFF